MKTLSKDTKMKLAFGLVFILIIVGYFAYKFSGNTSSSETDTTSLTSDPTIKEDTKKNEYEVTNQDLTQNMFGSTTSSSDTVSAQKKDVVESKQPVRKKVVSRPSTVMAALDTRPKLEIKITREEPRLAAIPEKKKPKIYFVIVKEDDYKSPFSVRKQSNDYGKDPKSQVKLFRAKVYGSQKIRSNETLTIRNIEDISIGNKIIPSGSIFYGTTSISGNRMFVSLNSCVTPGGNFGVTLSLYDSDYGKGIFLKETMDIEVERSGDQVIDQSVNLLSPTAQIAGTIAKESAKQVQRSLARQNKISVVLEDSYDVMIGVPISKEEI
jgi:hypothetical protein